MRTCGIVGRISCGALFPHVRYVFIYARTLAHTCERQYILLTYNSAVNPTAINIPPTHPMPAHPCVGRHPRCRRRRRQATHPTESYSFTKTSNFPNYETLSYCSRIGVHVASAPGGWVGESGHPHVLCVQTRRPTRQGEVVAGRKRGSHILAKENDSVVPGFHTIVTERGFYEHSLAFNYSLTHLCIYPWNLASAVTCFNAIY